MERKRNIYRLQFEGNLMVWTMFTGCTWRSKNTSLTLFFAGGTLQRPHGAILQNMQFSTSDLSKNVRQILNFSGIQVKNLLRNGKTRKQHFLHKINYARLWGQVERFASRNNASQTALEDKKSKFNMFSQAQVFQKPLQVVEWSYV